MNRTLLTAAVLGWLALNAPAAGAADLVFAVTEGVTYYQTNKEITARFQPLTEIISRALKRPVRTVVVSAYNDLRAGLARQEYDLAFVHPAHVALAAVKSGKYKSVAWTTGYTDYTVSLLMNKDQPFTRLEDLRGRTVVSPDPDSITAAMLRSMLRDQKLGPADVKIITTRYQDAVPFYVEYGFAQAGATAAKAVVQAWTQKGGKVLLSSRPVPIKQMIASTSLSAGDAQQIHDALLALTQNDAGRSALATLGYTGFVDPSRDDELKTIVWLGL
jgi:ABC-type phosphate/phosphonate transport system substrate-binding protein